MRQDKITIAFKVYFDKDRECVVKNETRFMKS